MANFSVKGSNATLSFTGNGGKEHTAHVRVVDTSYTFGVNSVESHARTTRAFYPHRRALGQFSLVVHSIGYREFRNFNNWLRLYAETLMTGQMGNRKGAAALEVLIPSRHFHKVGILTTGIDDHDNVGSMVFASDLQFMMLKDFNDPGTAVVSTHEASFFVAPELQNVYTGYRKGSNVRSIIDTSGTGAFFPVTTSSYKDTDTSIYDFPQFPVQGPPGRTGGGAGSR